MAKLIQVENDSDLEKVNVDEIRGGEDYHITIIAENNNLRGYFIDDDTSAESNLTVVEIPGGEKGAGPSIWQLIQSPVDLLAFTVVAVIGKGFLERLGSLFAETLYKKLSGHNLPSQIHVHYPDENISLTVVLPAKIKEDEAGSLNSLINEYVQRMKTGETATVFFSPKERCLVSLMSHNYN